MKRANLQKRAGVAGRFGGVGWVVVLALLFPAFGVVAQVAPADPFTGATPAERRFAERFLNGFADGEFRGGLIDQKRFVHESLKPFGLDASQLERFYKPELGAKFFEGLVQARTEEGSLALLRFRTNDKQRTALFRVTDVTGINYFEFVLHEQADGEVAAVDVEVYMAGERLTQTMRRLWIPAVAQLDPQVKKHMGERNRVLMDHLSHVQAMARARKAGDFQATLRIYERLPESVQEELVCMIVAIESYAMTEQWGRYEDVLERYSQLHGAASNQELLVLDLHFLKEQYDKALAAVDGLDKRVGGDPYLDLYRANITHMQDEYRKALGFIDRGLKADPTMLDLYWVGIDMALYEEDWPTVSRLLTAVEAQGVELIDLATVEGYESYVASDEYRRWLASRRPADP
ncbi:MAG: tetratricopeptide repeat protein [Phycisphaeraceae bacterium]